MAKTAGRLKIRGHHLLCIQGFQGYGYSPDFVANMAQIVESLNSRPDTEIEMVAECDDICSACPHRQGRHCHKRADSPQAVTNHDRRVLGKLGLEVGWWGTAQEVFALASARLSSLAEAREVCGKCGWQEQCLWFASRAPDVQQP